MSGVDVMAGCCQPLKLGGDPSWDDFLATDDFPWFEMDEIQETRVCCSHNSFIGGAS